VGHRQPESPPRRRRLRGLLIGVATIALAVGLVWRYQSQLIGIGVRWYLQRIALAEQGAGQPDQRRTLVQRTHRLLLLAPPPDPLIPELYDYLTLLSQRLATGDVDWDWGAYLYTSHVRDAEVQRPRGAPRRTVPELEQELDGEVRFFSIQRRTGPLGGLGDLLGESYTVEEIEAAHRQGRELGMPQAPRGSE